MGMDTHVRICHPVDPRRVWEVVRVLVEAPDEWIYDQVPRNADDRWQQNAEWRAHPDQGAMSLVSMTYGHEGAPLIDPPGWYGDEGDPPEGYVEVSFNNNYEWGTEGRDRHDRYWAGLFLGFGSFDHPGQVIWMRGECCARWHEHVQPALAEEADAWGNFEGMAPFVPFRSPSAAEPTVSTP